MTDRDAERATRAFTRMRSLGQNCTCSNKSINTSHFTHSDVMGNIVGQFWFLCVEKHTWKNVYVPLRYSL